MSGRGFDIARLISMVRSPGIDTRVWLSFAEVGAVEVVTGKNAGIYVDVTLLPTGEEYTAWMGAPWAGNQSGIYFPIVAGDLVLVAIPYGDPGAGCTIITRLNGGDNPPPAEYVENGAPSGDVIIVTTAETNVRVIVKGEGNVRFEIQGSGDVTFDMQGTGKVGIGADPGAAGMQPIGLGNTIQAELESIRTAFNAHTHVASSFGAPTTTPVPLIGPISDVKATKGEVK